MMQFQAYRDDIDAMIEAALAAADPVSAVNRRLKRQEDRLLVDGKPIPLTGRTVTLISVGKAAVPMAQTALALLDGIDVRALVITKTAQGAHFDADVTVVEAGHPVPTDASLQAGRLALEMANSAEITDLVLCLISGGASALMTQPLVPLADWQALTEALLASGCTIGELNTVRRVLDRVKGGGLARAASPAPIVSLILSDVVPGGSEDVLAAIGSGPTVPTQVHPRDALAVLSRYDVAPRLDPAAWQRIMVALKELVAQGVSAEGVRVLNLIVGDVGQAAQAALAAAIRRGFVAQLLTTRLQGEAGEVGKFAAALAQDLQPGHAYVLGGETTVTFTTAGQGGRNQELALAAALALEGVDHVAVATLATDGEDGPTDAAGAVVTGNTVKLGRDAGLSAQQALDAHDSYTFFSQLDAAYPHLAETHILTGSTMTNVNDLLFILRYPADA